MTWYLIIIILLLGIIVIFYPIIILFIKHGLNILTSESFAYIYAFLLIRGIPIILLIIFPLILCVSISGYLYCRLRRLYIKKSCIEGNDSDNIQE